MDISNLGEIIDKCKKGNKEAWKMIVENYSKMVFNIALNFIGDRDEAADITQEIFLKVYRNIDKFVLEKSFNAWITTVTKNYCIDYWRKKKKDISLEDVLESVINDMRSPEENAIKNSEIEYLRIVIQKINPEIRIFLILRDVLLFSYQEIAEYFSLPEGTVKSRINRARNKLIDLYFKGVESDGL